MKVKDLIKKLKELNQEADVNISISQNNVIVVAGGNTLKVDDEGVLVFINGKIK